MSTHRLTDYFMPHLPSGARDRIHAPNQLEKLLVDISRQAASTWPGFSLSPDVFLPFLARRIPENNSADKALKDLKVSDLYLACACLKRDLKAVALFESSLLPETEAALAHMETPSVQIEDIKQILCQKLLIGDGKNPPKLSRYSGRGDLRSWLRVTAIRAALDVLRREKNTQELDDSVFDDLVSKSEDEEIQYLKRLYRNEFKIAFQEALAALTSRERNILRHQLLDGLTLEQVGMIYNVHRATVARWNGSLRNKLLRETRQSLYSRLNIDHTELESIMRMIQSHFDVSVRRYLYKKVKAFCMYHL